MKLFLRKLICCSVVALCFVVIQDMDFNDPYLNQNDLLVSTDK